MASAIDSTVHAGFASSEVDGDAAGVEHRGHGLAAVLDAPEDRAHASDELARRERLRDVVVGAELEAEHAVDLSRSCREDEDREVWVGATSNPAAHLHAVDRSRQPHVEDREHGLLVSNQLEAPFTVRGLDHAEPRISEIEIEQIGDVRIVFDHDDRLISCHPPKDVIVRRLRFF